MLVATGRATERSVDVHEGFVKATEVLIKGIHGHGLAGVIHGD